MMQFESIPHSVPSGPGKVCKYAHHDETDRHGLFRGSIQSEITIEVGFDAHISCEEQNDCWDEEADRVMYIRRTFGHRGRKNEHLWAAFICHASPKWTTTVDTNYNAVYVTMR
jgi:hypothetical protein